MMPIATISLVTADQLSCRLAAADDHAWPECTSTARNDHSFVCESQPIRLISAIVARLALSAAPSRPQRAPAAPSAPAKSPIDTVIGVKGI
jgi:hypothetical protein